MIVFKNASFGVLAPIAGGDETEDFCKIKPNISANAQKINSRNQTEDFCKIKPKISAKSNRKFL